MNRETRFLRDISHKINMAMLFFFALALTFIIAVDIVAEKVSPDSVETDLNWNSGWLLTDGTAFSLPCTDNENDSLTIRNTLPQDLTAQDRLVISCAYQPVQVMVDGKQVPVVGTFEGHIVYASAYSQVCLSPEMSGKEIQITFLSQGGKPWMEIYNIQLGNFDMIWKASLEKDTMAIITGAILLAMSPMILILGLLQYKPAVQVMNKRIQSFIPASIVSFMFATWTLVDTETIALLFGGNPSYVFVNIFAYLFIMGPWLLHLSLTEGKIGVPIRILALSGLVEIGVIIVAALFGQFNFPLYLSLSHLIGGGVETAILIITFRIARRRKDAFGKLLFASAAWLAITGALTAYSFYFMCSPDNVYAMRYGVLGYAVVMFLDLVFTMRSINKRYMAEVEAARQAAEAANRAKSDFLSSMSHDIRTPMNAIMGFTTIALTDIDNQNVVQDSLQKISLSSKHLLGLINDILDMSKIESGKITLARTETSLHELFDNLLSIVQPQIKCRRQKLEIIPENITSETVYCDNVRLNQILLNLLSNAIKYTPEEGHIGVTLRQEESPRGEKWVRTIFRIADTGIGMSPEFLEHIFDSFARENDFRVHATEGSGLGMSITKHIIDLMEGTISVESRLNEGSTFLVTLDLERITGPEQNCALPSLNVLIVAGNEAFCLSAVNTLQDMGLHADFALDGVSASEKIAKCSQGLSPYHMILIDWHLPDMDGIETARRIREQVGENVPILLVTAYDWSEIEQEARESGVSGFLSKPLFKSTLCCGLMRYVCEDGDSAEPEREDRADFAGRRILLAEDNDLNAEIAQNILSFSGFVVDWAEDGEACLRMFTESEPGYYDIILMDIRMPRMDGYQSTTAIRALERPDATAIPILAMTANAFSEDIQHCINVGMNGHIAKPLDTKLLLRMISGYLK